MKEKLLRALEKSPVLYNMALVFKYRHDERYMELVQGLRKNPDLIELRSTKDSSEKGSIVYDIEISGKNDGFFALVRWTLDALYFCDCYSFLPRIRFSKDILYYDETMPVDKNPFEYYFEQPFSQEQLPVGAIVHYEPRNGLKAENLNCSVSYQISEEYISQMARIMKKYLRFNEQTLGIIVEQIRKRKVNETVLGVHIRGTDYKSNYRNHPQYIPPSVYYEYIDAAMEEYEFEKVYLATDDDEILKEFLERYGKEKVLYSADTLRSSGTQGVHTMEKAVREHHKYMLGMDVICDMCALAACGGLISSLSQVSLICRIYKKSKDQKFRYDETLNLGINKTGKIFKVMKNQ